MYLITAKICFYYSTGYHRTSKTLVSSSIFYILPKFFLLPRLIRNTSDMWQNLFLMYFKARNAYLLSEAHYSILGAPYCLAVPSWNHYQIFLPSLGTWAPISVLLISSQDRNRPWSSGEDRCGRSSSHACAPRWRLIHYVALGEFLSLHRPTWTMS